MKILVTGSSGHLGEAIMRTLRGMTCEPLGLDVIASPFTAFVGSIANRDIVKKCMRGVEVVIHTATLHKPHVATHTRQEFIDTNVTGTLNLLEEAVNNGVASFIFTSTTSTFGRALTPPPGEPAAWVTECMKTVPKNIYGVTKTTAEDLCELFNRLYKLPSIILRTSRFFPGDDDDSAVRAALTGENLRANEYLHRRVDVQDVVDAHLLAVEKAPTIGFARYIISATTPFLPEDLFDLRINAPAVVAKRVPRYEEVFARHGWMMHPTIDRVYVNELARRDLGWMPQYDFGRVVECLKVGEDPRSPLARLIGTKR